METNVQEHFTLAANEFQIEQENGFFVPFGDYPYRRDDGQVITQRFDEASGALLIEQFRPDVFSLLKSKRRPVYIGHPDAPGNETRWPDKKAYGWLTGAEQTTHAEQAGVLFHCKWSTAGRELISNGHYLYYSPNWGMQPIGHDESGRQCFRPALLFSMGLVNDPNISVPAMANENTKPNTNKENPTMDPLKQLLMKLGALLGINEATEETVLQHCRTLQNGLMAANQAKATAEAALSAANEAQTAAEQARAEAETAKTAAETRAANEHTARIDDRLELAVNEGRITAADKPNWLTVFNENFEAATLKVAALKPLGGTSQTQHLGGRSTSPAAPDAMLSAVNEVMTQKGCSYEQAWNEVSATKPELLEALNPKK